MLDMKRIRAAAAEARYTCNPTDEELLAARRQAREARKSLANRLRDLIKARRSQKPLPGQMGLFGAPEAKPAGPVQGHVAKPPKGFQPIPHSKKGGYVKVEGTKRTYWYPGQGVVGKPHEADAGATPHQEATAQHVLQQMAHLEGKGKISREELEHTRQAIQNAWPEGPKSAPPKVLEHYSRLREMAAAGPEEPEAPEPEVKIKRPGKEPATAKEIKQERAAVQAEKKAAKEKAARATPEEKKAARKKAAKERAAEKEAAAAEDKAKKEKAEAAAKKKVEREKKRDAAKKKDRGKGKDSLTPEQEKANKEIERALDHGELSMIMARNPDGLKDAVGRTLSTLMGAYDGPGDIPKSHRENAELLIALDDALDEDEQGTIDKLQDRAEAWKRRTVKQEREGEVESTWAERIRKVVVSEKPATSQKPKRTKKQLKKEHEQKADAHYQESNRHQRSAMGAEGNARKWHQNARDLHEMASDAYSEAAENPGDEKVRERADKLSEKAHGTSKEIQRMFAKSMSKALPPAGKPGGSKTPPKGYPESKKQYADPANFKYPLDTEKHVRAAISYFSKPKNAGVYSGEQQRAIWGRIKSAAKKLGIELSEESGPPSVGKALREDETMRPQSGEDRISKPIQKSVRVNRCTVHLDHDEALSKALEDGELGIGTVPRTHASKAMLRKSAVGGEGFTERGQDMRETVARDEADRVILRDDPAGNCGNGGLAEWFSDAQKTQDPAVRTQAVITKGMDQDRVNVIDDSDPYAQRMHRADPRTKSAAFDIDYAYNRDARRSR